MVITQLHQQATQQVRSNVVVADPFHTPRVRCLLGEGRLIFDDKQALCLREGRTELLTLFILLREAELHGINDDAPPITPSVCLLPMLGRVFRVGCLIHSLDRFLVRELHQLEQLLTILEHHLVNNYTRTCEVAQDSPFFSHLADAHTLLRRVCLDGVILRIVLLYEWRDAIEVNLLSDFDSSLTALYQLFLAVELDLVNADDSDVVVIEDGSVRTQRRILPVVWPLDEVHTDTNQESRCCLLTFQVHFSREFLGEELPKVLVVFGEFHRNRLSQFLLCTFEDGGMDWFLESDVVVLTNVRNFYGIDIELRRSRIGTGIVCCRAVV